MRIEFSIEPASLRTFIGSVEATLRNVGRATKAGTEQACQEILDASLDQVPMDTGTLASTGFYEVNRRTDIGGYTYEGVVGYAGMSGAGAGHNAFNPKNGMSAAEYAWDVHENLDVYHAIGKAKFLEDPVRAYGQRNFKRVAESHLHRALKNSGGS